MGRNTAAKVRESESLRVFAYHDYRAFLKDWISAMKRDRGLSLRKVADEAQMSPAYLSMILSGERNLSTDAMEKLIPIFGFSVSEETYFKFLVTIADSESHQKRIEALNEIQKLPGYKNLNQKETEAYRYLTSWYYVAIREMVALPDFRLDAQWIQSQLKYSVPLSEITKAIKFLIDFNFIKVDETGRVKLAEKQVDCFGGVYKIALAEFHKEMFSLASESIDKTPRRQRSLTFHTFAISSNQFQNVKKILDEAMEKIVALESAQKNPDAVYHVSFAGFPLTKLKEREEEANEEV